MADRKRKKRKKGPLRRLRRAVMSQPAVVRFAALLVSLLARLWLRTVEYRFWAGFGASPAWMPRRAIYVFWHEMLLFPAHTHVAFNVATLISQHRDGELLSHTVGLLGGKVVRGSTRRQALPGLRAMIRQGDFSHLALTPDGPKGPRRVVQPGVVFLASRTGMPIVPMGFAYRRCLRARSWDKLAMPVPGTAARGATGTPIDVPADLTREQIEEYTRRVQAALDEAQAHAEALAAGEPSDRALLNLAQAQGPQPPANLLGCS